MRLESIWLLYPPMHTVAPSFLDLIWLLKPPRHVVVP